MLADKLIINCANCNIPLANYCTRTSILSNLTDVCNFKSVKDVNFCDMLFQIFKLQQSIINYGDASLKQSELCRYCTTNFISLSYVYNKILTDANDSSSAFSKILQSKKDDPEPGRPTEKCDVNLLQVDFSVQNLVGDHDNRERDADYLPHFEPDSEEALGLEYLGLIRKKRFKDGEIDNNYRPREVNELINADLLFPEINISGDQVLEDVFVPSSEALKPTLSGSLKPSSTKKRRSLNSTARCSICKKTFRHPQRLLQHLKTHHAEETSDQAPGTADKNVSPGKSNVRKNQAGKSPKVLKSPENKSKPSLSSKVKSNNNEGKKEKRTKKQVDNTCKVCGRNFKHSSFLHQHLQVHSNDKKCPKCGKKCKSSDLLKRHMQIHNKNNSIFKCDDCGREFPNLLGLQVHAVSHTRTLYTCVGCKRKFKIEKNYIQHQETARCTEKKHACPTCGKLFKNKDKVKRHLISMHSETKPFTCDLCGKGFRSQADLKFHEVNAHICGESKEYQCDQCGKRFKSLDTLKSHEMYSHKMEKKHFCSTCGKGFPLLTTLKIHEVSHSTERPYMCIYCGRTYKHANDLKSHEVVHYKDEEKPFICPICGSRFHRKDVLRLHQARDKHYGPDIPTLPAIKKPELIKTKKQTSKLLSKIGLELVKLQSEPETENPSVVNSNEISEPPALLSLPGPSRTQDIPRTTSNSVTNLFPHPLHSGMMPTLITPSSTPMTLVHKPISSHSQLPPSNSMSQNSLSVPHVAANEALSDFYRIMFDLT